MKRVTLYTVNTSEVTVVDRLETLPYFRADQLSPVVNSNEVVQTYEVLPIYSMVRDGETFYVAVSPEIKELFLALPKEDLAALQGKIGSLERELEKAKGEAQDYWQMWVYEEEKSLDLWQEVRDLKANLKEASSFWNRLRNLFRSPENWK